MFNMTIYSQESLPTFITDSLDIYAKNQQEKWQIPGMAIAIIKDGKVVKTFTNGVTDYTTKHPVDKNTLFMIGSNSKAFTSILTATLASEKKLSLTDPVQKWLPYFELYDPYLTKNVTITDALSHRIGFETFQGDFLNFDNSLTSEEVIKKFSLIKPTYGFREKWGYFNTGYTIAGEIIEKATGKSWATQLQERIFSPLEMTRSLALSRDIQTATNGARAHSVINNILVEIPYGDIDATAPAGSISSSISDMSKWVITLLNDGKYNDKQALPLEALKETKKPRSILGSADYPFQLYGLGWFIESRGEHTMVYHTGGIHGFLSSVTMIPDKNLGVIILTNTDSNYLYEGLKHEIINEFLLKGDKPKVIDRYYDFYLQDQEDDKKQNETWLNKLASDNKPSIPLIDFVGTYKNQVYGEVEISQKNPSTLLITFEHHENLDVSLQHLENDIFYAKFNDAGYGKAEFPFVIENNKVIKFTLTLDPNIENTTYDFYKK